MALLHSQWIPALCAFLCVMLRIISVPRVDSIDDNDQPSFIQDNWTAPLSALLRKPPSFIDVNSVSSFHCSIHFLKPKPSSVIFETKNRLRSLAFFYALLSGDIELNPGPRKLKYPCEICHKAAKWGQKAIECDQCQGWFHASCLKMSDNIYHVLAQHPSYSWTCDHCGMPNFSTTFFDELNDVESTNSFSLLDSTQHAQVNRSTSQNQDINLGEPVQTSSPKLKRRSSKDGHPTSEGDPKKGLKVKNKTTKKGKRHQSTHLKIVNMNCQSIRSKLPTFEALLDGENPDIIVGTESWLNDTISTGEIFPPCYNVFRRDRETEQRGGGVFIAVKNTLLACAEPDLQTNSEIIWISIQVKGISPLYIGAFYRPPSTDRNYLIELDTSLST